MSICLSEAVESGQRICLPGPVGKKAWDGLGLARQKDGWREVQQTPRVAVWFLLICPLIHDHPPAMPRRSTSTQLCPCQPQRLAMATCHPPCPMAHPQQRRCLLLAWGTQAPPLGLTQGSLYERCGTRALRGGFGW